jgi:hypothetical protein
MLRHLWILGPLIYCTAAAAADACDPGTPHPNAAEQINQFAFLIGDHEVTLHAWSANGWTPPRPLNARWRGWYGLDGMTIQDEWSDPDPNTGGLGVNIRLYDADENVWKMMWVSTSGRQVQELRAQMQGGELRMWQVYPERPGWKAVFEVLDEQRWARVSYQQDAQGTWQPQFRLEARRQPCQ